MNSIASAFEAAFRVDALLLGGSFVGNPAFQKIAAGLKKETQIPVVLFPGGCSHVTPGPDAILFTTLISGRNPQYLIDEQVKGAVLVRSLRMEAIPTAYMLIESGRTTAVEYISNTRPIPADKPAIAAAHAMAAELMGQRWIYLEAGSGALNAVPAPMVKMVRASVGLHVIVGGGIVGLTCAEELSRRGRSVTILDRKTPGGEASWAAGGMLAADYEGALGELGKTSRALWPPLCDRLHSARPRPEGTLVPARDAREAELLRARLPQAQWLSSDEAARREPALGAISGAAWPPIRASP